MFSRRILIATFIAVFLAGALALSFSSVWCANSSARSLPAPTPHVCAAGTMGKLGHIAMAALLCAAAIPAMRAARVLAKTITMRAYGVVVEKQDAPLPALLRARKLIRIMKTLQTKRRAISLGLITQRSPGVSAA